MWLFYALMAPFFFSITHILDSFCVEDIFERPWMGMVTSAMASIIVFIPLPYIIPFLNWESPTWQIIGLALIAGALIQGSHYLYFQSLSFSEAGIVAAYWNLIPVFVPILSFLIFRDILNITQYIGITILIVASTYMLLIDHNSRAGKTAFLLMVLASFLQACAYILLDYVYKFIPFFQGYIIMLISLILVGITPLLFPSIQSIFKQSFSRLKKASKIIITIEGFYLLALASAQKAISIGDPALVAAVETTIPAFTLIISVLLLGHIRTAKYGDPKSEHHLQIKLTLISAMCIGVWFVS